MCIILPGIRTLVQHFYILEHQPMHPDRCPSCGEAALVKHGFYYRKADRESGDLNPVPVQRFFCSSCEVTCSALPECIPSHRWYLWDVQQQALLLYLAGLSLRAITKVLSLCALSVVRLKEPTHLEKNGPSKTASRLFRFLPNGIVLVK